MKLLVTGSSGLLGSALLPLLSTSGHEVTCLFRSESQVKGKDNSTANTVCWNPEAGFIETNHLHGTEAVIHLAGENIAAGRWNAARKARILQSRVQGTQLLVQTLTQLDPKPKLLLSASAIGYYGNRGDEIVNETSGSGNDFLAQVCRQWEEAMTPAIDAGIRVVNLRLGVVLSSAGGMLQRLLMPFKMGVGGTVGNGQQYISWISEVDVLGSIVHILTNESLQGPVNIVAPHPVTNQQFTKALGRVLHRPTILPLPAPAARLLFGEMADALLLASTRVEPARLSSSGYKFLHPHLEEALRQLVEP